MTSQLCLSECMCAASCLALVSLMCPPLCNCPPPSVTSPGLGGQMFHLDSQFALPVGM